MWMRPEIADARLNTNEGDWVRMEFSYDYMGRRIAKKYLRGEGDTVWSLEKAAENVLWGADRFEKFVYDGWMPVAAYKSAISDGLFLGFPGSWAWGPDMSGTLGGAGGIGGLAIAADDEWDAAHPSSGMGPMLPLYVGNGNIKRMVPAWDVTVVAAKYEYGPFGETRSIDGPLGQRNPFRWSTKFTDPETGLVYYGHRYYSASLGRWIGRDPIGESGDQNVYRGVNNDPIGAVDFLGHSTVRYADVDGLYANIGIVSLGVGGAFVGIDLEFGLAATVDCPEQMLEIEVYAQAGVAFDLTGLSILRTVRAVRAIKQRIDDLARFDRRRLTPGAGFNIGVGLTDHLPVGEESFFDNIYIYLNGRWHGQLPLVLDPYSRSSE